MKDDEELELLLGEIPHAISLNHHHHHFRHGHGCDHHHDHNTLGQSLLAHKMGDTMMYGMGIMYDDATLGSHHNINGKQHTSCSSPVSGFSLQSDGGSSSSLFSGGHSFSDNGSPTTPALEDLQSHSNIGNVFDELSLSRNLSRMYVSKEPEDVKLLNLNGRQYLDGVSGGHVGANLDQHGLFYGRGIADFGRFQCPVPGNPLNLEGNVLGSRYSPSRSGEPFSRLYVGNGSVSGNICLRRGMDGHHYVGFPVTNLSGTLSLPSVTEAQYYAPRHGVGILSKSDAFHSLDVPQLAQMKTHGNVENVNYFQKPITNACKVVPPRIRVPHGSLEPLSGEESLIIQGENLNYALSRVQEQSRHSKVSPYEADVNQEKQSLVDGCSRIAGNQESAQSLRLCCPFSLPLKCNSLGEAQGYIYLIAKDQHGCRFLQRMFDEGTPQDVQVIFTEIIDHVVELMMNPFGNYLMQKLLEVCNEEQRMQILLRVTAKPGDLIRISLNTHGTRVVQKLIETLKSRQQILLVISALEPGFLALIKDLNGNHVVQRCLQCLSYEDSKFIFVAAAKYCVDIATHQHGCCVLQRCISHSSGEHRENLIAEISANGLLLAQDAFGNYVVQFILELKIPYAATKLVYQFEGNYVHLSTQKFSSHVVEKCLAVCNNEVRSTIIHELLSATHFEQLLQDPHANYVVQTALKVSEGPLHDSLVEAIESHKAISRNSPYSKRIFSHKLLKK